MFAMKVKLPLIILLAACLAAGSLAALAADPQPVAPEKSGAANPEQDAATRTGRSGAAELEVNQAELQGNSELFLDPGAQQLPLKPMTLEINAVMETARLQVVELQAQFDKEPNAEAALVIMRRIEQTKANAELDVLRVQARHARAAGDEELAQRIEADLTNMTTPRPRRQPIERPASDADHR